MHRSAYGSNPYGKGHGNREILYEHTWLGPLGFDKFRSSDGLPGLEDRHKNFMEHSKDNAFLFCARCSDHRSAKLGTKNFSEYCRVFPVTH